MPGATRFRAALAAERAGSQTGDAVSIHFLRTVTLEGIGPFLARFGQERALVPSVTFGTYSGAEIDVGSGAAEPHDIVVACLSLDQFVRDWEIGPWTSETVIAELDRLFGKLVAHFSGVIVANTFLPPRFNTGGARDNHRAGSLKRRVEAVNAALKDLVDRHNGRCLLIDFADMMASAGADRAFDHRLGYLMRAPFAPAFLEAYARALIRIAAALKGKTKKCLVLDCDNTLWGGILGEDGLDGIALSSTEFPGAAFYDFQKSILRLHDEGVLIALCSRNNEADVFEVLDKHPHCLLKRAHLAAYRVNWSDKAANIEALADELNIGLEHIVFVDDSPFDCGHVRASLPAVTTLTVPERLSDLPDLVLKDGYFETLVRTAEDTKRTRMLQEEGRRRAALDRAASFEEYLASLEIKAHIHRATPKERARVAQLTQKTNQFNLTTIRLSEGDIQSRIDADDRAVFTVTVCDRVGDLGLTGVLLARKEGAAGVVEGLLLSCRALGRRVEDAFVAACLRELADTWRVAHWEAAYRPTAKNVQVAEFWDRFGFAVTATEPDGTKRYRLDAPVPAAADTPFVVVIRE